MALIRVEVGHDDDALRRSARRRNLRRQLYPVADHDGLAPRQAGASDGIFHHRGRVADHAMSETIAGPLPGKEQPDPAGHGGEAPP